MIRLGGKLALLSALGLTVFTYGGGAEPLRVVYEKALPGSERVRVLFVGDIMLDRTIRSILERNGEEAIFGEIRGFLRDADFVVGNLEGPITSFASLSAGTKVGDPNNTRFTFDPDVAGLLAEVGFKFVSIGNNHITDFGREGVRETKKSLDAVGIRYSGDPFEPDLEPVIVSIRGVRIAFVTYNQFIRADAALARSVLTHAKEGNSDFVVLLAHWGEEYESAPPESVRTLAKSFAEAGADLIIGTHSHVIGEKEDMGATRVYYSLGNFIFDQYWERHVRCGWAVSVSLTKMGSQTTASYREQEVGLLRSGATVLGCS